MTESATSLVAASTLSQDGKEQAMLHAIYRFLSTDHEARDMNAKRIGAIAGVGSQADKYVRTFEDLGIIKRRMEYGTPKNGLSSGRHFHWTALVEEDEALLMLKKFQAARPSAIKDNRENGRRQEVATKAAAKKAASIAPSFVPTPVVTLATQDSEEETRAIAGPETGEHLGDLMSSAIRGLRKDESAALIEAARQYANRGQSLQTKLDELARLAAEVGVKFNVDIARTAISLDHDDRLEAIVPVLPYITRLEETVDRMGKQLVSQSGKVRDYDKAIADNRRLKERLEQLISARAMAGQVRSASTDGR